ncbi:response regulator transcription factor [Acidaminobacter sp. JC074]|uniref:response regulator transcription factor n=1 Tax=Acidaminobacter sp. JC074 TaxID=2530199 RepID=UPI00210517E3|nr:response regulator transcription factor [Acidaminobacter sp. JC074]
MRIYIVEDEKQLQQLLVSYLVEAGYQVTAFDNGRLAKNRIDDEPDLWILDIMLPEVDGFTLIKAIKEKNPQMPVIFMSARSAELDRVIGLEMGCDDYLPKPFLPRELVLRVKRLMSYVRPVESNEKIGPYTFDTNKRMLILNQDQIELTVKEYDILQLFSKNLDKAISRTEILDSVWGMDYFGSERVVDDTLRRLRKKAPDLPFEAVYGYGYMLKEF